MDECKHEKAVVKSNVRVGNSTNIVYHCAECDSTREREIFSVRFGVDKDGHSGFTCFSDNQGVWIKKEAAVSK